MVVVIDPFLHSFHSLLHTNNFRSLCFRRVQFFFLSYSVCFRVRYKETINPTEIDINACRLRTSRRFCCGCCVFETTKMGNFSEFVFVNVSNVCDYAMQHNCRAAILLPHLRRRRFCLHLTIICKLLLLCNAHSSERTVSIGTGFKEENTERKKPYFIFPISAST